MASTRFREAWRAGRTPAPVALLALVLAVAGCKSYGFMPVDVAYGRLSPPYLVRLVNDTGAPFEVQPSKTGTVAGYAAIRVPPGDSFLTLLQLRRFTVGSGSSVRGAQVLDHPYFEHSSPDMAELRLRQDEPHAVLISIRHASWFEGYTRQEATPLELVVAVREFSRRPLFPRGPHGGP
jgi:hypothetical protein